jgi:hypothetical protein
MPTSNFASIIRKRLRQAAASRETDAPLPDLVSTVTKEFKDHELTGEERAECLRSFIDKEAKAIFKPRSQPLQLDWLREQGVPLPQARILVELNMTAVYVVDTEGKKRRRSLFGKDRVSRTEGSSAIEPTRQKGQEIINKAHLLDQLFKLPGYYK